MSNDGSNKPPKKTPAEKIYQNLKKTKNFHNRSVPIKFANPNFREDKKVDSGKSNKLVDKSAIENHALSVIKNLSSIDITPVSVGSVVKNHKKDGQVEEDVIVLD